jgi:hypothetical protein
MSFSPRQQGEFRVLVAKAFARACHREEFAREAGLGGPAFKRAWYEGELEQSTGKRSSTACNAGRDYEAAMAHFERLADDGSFAWQLKGAQGDATRILHVIREKMGEFELSEGYMLGIAQQELGFRPESLHALKPAMLMKILRRLLMQLQRQKRRGQETRTVMREEQPF